MSDYSHLAGNWNYPTALRFGVGKIKQLADACRELNITKPLLVTDPGVAKLPMVAEALSANKLSGIPTGLFSNIKANPTGKNVEDGLEIYRQGNYDGIIAFGGGSALDAAKVVALVAGQNLSIWDLEDVGDNWTRADIAKIAPIIAVPTTAGTGSEVGRASVIVHQEAHLKKIIFHPKMLPSIVISDPELTVGLPPKLTASTGMDALSHCLEAYSSPCYHPMADGIAVEGMRLINKWLPTAVKDGKNLEARSHMLVAASMGATAFQKGLGAIHSLAHPLGGVYDLPHGLTTAVLMPYVLKFNRPAIEEKMRRLAAWLELPDPSFQAMMEMVLKLRKEFEIPHTLAELEIDDSKIDEISEAAAADPTAPTNPIPLTSKETRKIFQQALNGEL